MNRMFQGTKFFNQPLNNWNVSNVRRMEEMFYKARSFNQPLNNWNVSNVSPMYRTFSCMTRNFNIQDNAPWYELLSDSSSDSSDDESSDESDNE